jgi:ribulose-5-phosphate 4-epimerase/fuculose-1-phosphate aldolase
MRKSTMIKSLINFAHKVKEAGLVISSSGNISVKLDEHSFAISASGSYLGELKKGDVSICYFADVDRFEGKKPSMETGFHRNIYLKRVDVGAVIHFQSLYATTLACCEDCDFDLNFIPEIPAYIKSVGIVPYSNPGTQPLADDIAKIIDNPDCHILVLQNHGQIAVGATLSAALRNAEFFEFACRILCQGRNLRRYEKQIVQELRNYGKPKTEKEMRKE